MLEMFHILSHKTVSNICYLIHRLKLEAQRDHKDCTENLTVGLFIAK